MILEVESVHGDTLLQGKRFEYTKLCTTVNELILLVGEKEFTSAFCMRYGYEAIPYDADVKVDYTIDLDTHLVINSRY